MPPIRLWVLIKIWLFIKAWKPFTNNSFNFVFKKRFLTFFHFLFYENIQAFYEQGKTNTRIQIIFINMQMQAF